MAHSGILSSLRPLSLLFLFIPLVYSDQQERHGEPSSLTRTTRNSQNEIITDDRYEELQESLRAIAKDVDALLPIDTVQSIADLIAFCGETQISKDVPENLRKIQKLVIDGFANMERAFDNAADTLECFFAFTAYDYNDHDLAVRSEMYLSSLVNQGTNVSAEFEMECTRRSYVAEPTVLVSSTFGRRCLTANNYSYAAMQEIKRIIKIDLFTLSVNALTCQRVKRRIYDFGLNSTFVKLQDVFVRLNHTQDTHELEGLRGTLKTFFHHRHFTNTTDFANSLVAKVKDYNGARVGYIAEIVPRGPEIDEETAIAPGYGNKLLWFKDVGKHSVSVYGTNLTTESTQAHRQWLNEHQETLKEALAARMREYPKSCPPAAEIAKELHAHYTMFPYVHVVTTPRSSDFIHYGDERSGGYFTFTHDYIKYKIKFLFLEFSPVPTTCTVHVVIGF